MLPFSFFFLYFSVCHSTFIKVISLASLSIINPWEGSNVANTAQGFFTLSLIKTLSFDSKSVPQFVYFSLLHSLRHTPFLSWKIRDSSSCHYAVLHRIKSKSLLMKHMLFMSDWWCWELTQSHLTEVGLISLTSDFKKNIKFSGFCVCWS